MVKKPNFCLARQAQAAVWQKWRNFGPDLMAHSMDRIRPLTIWTIWSSRHPSNTHDDLYKLQLIKNTWTTTLTKHDQHYVSMDCLYVSMDCLYVSMDCLQFTPTSTAAAHCNNLINSYHDSSWCGMQYIQCIHQKSLHDF